MALEIIKLRWALDKIVPYKKKPLQSAWRQGALDKLYAANDEPPAYYGRAQSIAWDKGHAAIVDEKVLAQLPERDRVLVESMRR